MNIIDEYFNQNTSTIIWELDEFSDWVMQNYKSIDFDSCMHLAEYLMTESKNINSVKLGIALIGNADISKIERIKEILIKLALCNEFTLYLILSMIGLDERNDIIFMLIKKVEGWGKIHLV